MVIILCAAVTLAAPWPTGPTPSRLADRIEAPAGTHRLAVPAGSFGAWLRDLPVKPGRPEVLLFDGRRKGNQGAHALVLDIDVGDRDLQQCADAVIRLRAEYLWASQRTESICFRFTSGDPAWWSRWRDGHRPEVRGAEVRWNKTAAANASYAAFRRYLANVFTYAGSHSLQRELLPVTDPARIEPGDVFVRGGFPGHAVIVVDVAQGEGGERWFLLAQSYMPAQQIHVLRNPASASPWYRAASTGELVTPEWRFEMTDLRRFGDAGCPSPR